MDKLADAHQGTTAMSQRPLSMFIKKLWMIVNDPESDELIRWSGDGKDIWILDANQFSKTVVPCYFKHSNWHSFVRQLNLYGFRKVYDMYSVDQNAADVKYDLYDSWQFRQSSFRRNQPHLLHRVKRNRKGRQLRHGAPHREPITTDTDPSIIAHITSDGVSNSPLQQHAVALRRLEAIEHNVEEVESQGISMQESLAAMRDLQGRQSQVCTSR